MSRWSALFCLPLALGCAPLAMEGAQNNGDPLADAGPQSRYLGGWPVNPNKDQMVDPGWGGDCPGSIGCECEVSDPASCSEGSCFQHARGQWCSPTPGTPVPRFYNHDQYGDSVELWDFGGQDKVIALDMSAAWCQPCKELARWLSTGDETVRERPWWNDRWLPIRDWLNEGRFYWITIIYEDANYETATGVEAQYWHEAFPHEKVPVLVDSEKELHTWIKPSGLPNMNLIDWDMKMMTYNPRGSTEALDALVQLFE